MDPWFVSDAESLCVYWHRSRTSGQHYNHKYKRKRKVEVEKSHTSILQPFASWMLLNNHGHDCELCVVAGCCHCARGFDLRGPGGHRSR